MLRVRHPTGHLWPARIQPIQLLDAPVEIAHSTRRWLRGLTVGPNRQRFGDHRTVVADQVRELIFALHRTTAGPVAFVDLMLATATAPRSAAGHRTVAIDLTGRHNGMREAADILATIDPSPSRVTVSSSPRPPTHDA